MDISQLLRYKAKLEEMYQDHNILYNEYVEWLKKLREPQQYKEIIAKYGQSVENLRKLVKEDIPQEEENLKAFKDMVDETQILDIMYNDLEKQVEELRSTYDTLQDERITQLQELITQRGDFMDLEKTYEKLSTFNQRIGNPIQNQDDRMIRDLDGILDSIFFK